MRAVRFDRYGDVDVLEVREVDDPVDAPGRVIVEVRAAGINPGEIAVREGLLHERWPASFPSGEGSDLAGVVRSVGSEVPAITVGDEVVGWSDERSAHAELVSVPAEHVVAKPAGLSWEVAGSLYVASMAGLASVRAVAVTAGDVVVVSASAGGVGSFAAQLARRTGAMVVGLAGEANHDWLRSRGIVPVRYGDRQSERVRAAAGGRVDAFIDTFGGGYVELALELGVPAERINTVIDYDAVATRGVKGEGTASIASAAAMTEVVDAVASGDVEVPIAATFALEDVRQAYRQLAERHTRGKIVLLP
jgi:NADPH:quinone reductase-like Zn-dependent oxidoreductase